MEGEVAKAELAVAIDRSVRMIDRYLSGDCNPPQRSCYPLALACGCSEEEALEIAKECSSERGRKTAS